MKPVCDFDVQFSFSLFINLVHSEISVIVRVILGRYSYLIKTFFLHIEVLAMSFQIGSEHLNHNLPNFLRLPTTDF